MPTFGIPEPCVDATAVQDYCDASTQLVSELVGSVITPLTALISRNETALEEMIALIKRDITSQQRQNTRALNVVLRVINTSLTQLTQQQQQWLDSMTPLIPGGLPRVIPTVPSGPSSLTTSGSTTTSSTTTTNTSTTAPAPVDGGTPFTPAAPVPLITDISSVSSDTLLSLIAQYGITYGDIINYANGGPTPSLPCLPGQAGAGGASGAVGAPGVGIGGAGGTGGAATASLVGSAGGTVSTTPAAGNVVGSTASALTQLALNVGYTAPQIAQYLDTGILPPATLTAVPAPVVRQRQQGPAVSLGPEEAVDLFSPDLEF